MPEAKILKRLVSQLKAKGMSDGQAHGIAITSLQKSGNLKKGSTEPTTKGVTRGNMTPAERAKDRAIKENPKLNPKDLTYNAKTNSVKRKKR